MDALQKKVKVIEKFLMNSHQKWIFNNFHKIWWRILRSTWILGKYSDISKFSLLHKTIPSQTIKNPFLTKGDCCFSIIWPKGPEPLAAKLVNRIHEIPGEYALWTAFYLIIFYLKIPYSGDLKCYHDYEI